jgi:ribosomal protein RSM22 (predicted rRNA methylase)
MTSFQGKERARPSALLLEILNRTQEKRGVTGIRQRASAVAELSHLFTKGRDALGSDYLGDAALADAYLAYFFPVNLAKIQVLLDELPPDWYRSAGGEPLRVLDVGAGPGTGALAVLDWLNQHHRDHMDRLAVAAVDASAEALAQARRLWTAYSKEAGLNDTSLMLHEGDLTRLKQGWRDQVAQRGPYDLIIAANCLNELSGRLQQASRDSAGLITDLLTQLTPHGTLMIVEPALRETSRALHQLRDQLLAEHRCTVYSPCLHEKNCPALHNPDDWCHEERVWQCPSSIHEIDQQVGFIKDALKFSYLMLRTDGRTIADRGPNIFRMVSELRTLKGDTRAWLCNELGRSEVGRLDRALSAGNAAWDDCQRGTILRIEGVMRKENASLGRILAEGTVEIVRPR